MDRPTIDVYDGAAHRWRDRRPLSDDLRDAALDFDRRAPDGLRLDLGCGVGRLLPHLGPVIGVDASIPMLRVAAPFGRPLVAGDLEALPLRRACAAGAWAEASYQHLAPGALPMALWDLHRVLEPGGVLRLSVVPGDGVLDPRPTDDFPGRLFAGWSDERLGDVLTGAGFDEVSVGGEGWRVATARRARTLADTVADGMRLLVCGLNPSLHAADAGVGYVGPGNRFWPVLETVLGYTRRDPAHLLRTHGVGMTDLVKRATPAASALSRTELRDGFARVERLVRWLRPHAVCFVGLTGYRAARGSAAIVGWQAEPVGGRPAYVMGSTSGRNAATGHDELADHLGRALAGPPSGVTRATRLSG